MASDNYDSIAKPTKGAWIIHHGRKTHSAVKGGSSFPALDTAGRAATLLSSLAATDEMTLPKERVDALARAADFNPILTLPPVLDILQRKRLIDRGADGSIAVIGLTSSATAGHAADLFDELAPSPEERASIVLAEVTTSAPLRFDIVSEFIGDEFGLTRADSADFVQSASQIGFVDAEGDAEDRLVFNGNLFKKGSSAKVKKIIDSISTEESSKVTELNEALSNKGCISVESVISMLGIPLFEKLRAAGMYDLQFVHNALGEFGFVTRPSAFHKFNDPLSDDAFDLAKALVAALFYGMSKSSAGRGKINMISALLRRLINGHDVGPATAIGQDYKVLEEAGVLKVWRDGFGHSMRLLKTDVGEMALKVLTQGDASTDNVSQPLIGSMSSYTAPEASRWQFRKLEQGTRSKKNTRNILESLRTGDKL